MSRTTRRARLDELQALHGIYERATRLLDPRWDGTRPSSLSTSTEDLMVIRDRAQDLFHRWTGLFPWDVSVTELHNRRPSPRVAAALRTHTPQVTSRIDTVSVPPEPARPPDMAARLCGSMVFTKQHPSGRLCRHWRKKGSPWCGEHTKRNQRRGRKNA